MRAVVIGGGIGGLVTAVALRRAGIEAVVHEARGGPAASAGLFLGLGVNGMRVLAELGLLEALLSADVVPTPVMDFGSWTGRRLGRVSNGWLEGGVPSVTIMRGELQRVLAEAAAERGVEVRYGKRFVAYEDLGDRVVARFEDGSEVEGDVLIGADGLRSRVRGQMLPEAAGPRYTGLLNLGGAVERSGLEPTPDTMHMLWGRRAFFGYTVRPTGEAWWFANIGVEREPGRGELRAVTTAEWKQRLVRLFDRDPSFVRTLIEATEEIGAYPIHDMPSIPAWHRGRVVLVGDAAHAVSPSSGQGASMAMEDAITLAKCLRDIGEPAAAFARYEALRRERAERIVATGRRRGAYKAVENRAAVFVRDLIMPIVFRLFVRDGALSWIYDHGIRWEERVV